uniref:Uncharacterized protein n=1 Tax=Vannella robusta TaxID=1487602 RepID=A0A7S4ID45_9EUKA
MQSTIVPVSLVVADSNGLKLELIDHYIKERAEEPEHKSVLSSLVGANSKEDKLNAARRIKLYVEAGEDLSHAYNEVHSQLTDKGELRRIFDEYKAAREDCIARMEAARAQLPSSLLKFNDTPIPVSIKNKHGVEKISEYIEARRADPRDTKGFGATIASVFGNDSYTKKGKLRAAQLLENSIQAGVPLTLVFNTEPSSYDDGTLKMIYLQYEKEQERIKKRLTDARKRLAGSVSPQQTGAKTASISEEHDALRRKYSKS